MTKEINYLQIKNYCEAGKLPFFPFVEPFWQLVLDYGDQSFEGLYVLQCILPGNPIQHSHQCYNLMSYF